MKSSSLVPRSWHHRLGILAVLCFGLIGAKPAAANVIYDFSLLANGSVGAIDIELQFPDFLPTGGLQVFGLNSPQIYSFSSGSPLDASTSVVGIEVLGTMTLFGVSLESSPGDQTELFNVSFPADFFVFGRAPTDAGTFTSSAGNVTSAFTLGTATPTGTLVVTSVPEPSTPFLFGFGLLAFGCFLKLRNRLV